MVYEIPPSLTCRMLNIGHLFSLDKKYYYVFDFRTTFNSYVYLKFECISYMYQIILFQMQVAQGEQSYISVFEIFREALKEVITRIKSKRVNVHLG